VSRLLTIPAGRRAKWGIVAVWALFVLLLLAADIPQRYADAETDDSASYLPSEAESTRALEASKRLDGGEELPVIIVYRRESGLSSEDEALIEADREALNTREGEGASTFRGTSQFGEPRFSDQRDTALLAADLPGNSESEALLDAVDRVRAAVSGSTNGLDVRVTGPAGVASDADEVFETINSTLVLAAAALIFALLIAIYRSPIFVWIPLMAVAAAELATRAAGLALAESGVRINSQTSAIVSVLVLGAGTDYGLVLIARFREELHRYADHHDALAVALRSTGPGIVASGGAVAAALACLSVAEVNGTAGLGPVAAVAIVVTVVAMVTLLPALLAVTGRRAFWRPPILGRDDGIPRAGPLDRSPDRRSWGRFGAALAARPRRVWTSTAAVLGILALGLVVMDTGLAQNENLRGDVESVEGQRLIAGSFSAGESAPTEIFVPDPGDVEAVRTAAEQTPGVDSAEPGVVGSTETIVSVVLDSDPFSDAAIESVPLLRAAVKDAGGQEILVGGPTATEHDLREAAARDRAAIFPLSVVVVTLILIAVLRAVVAPLIMMATIVLSFAATLGFSALVFDLVLGFPGVDPSLPLYVFVFLVGLGTDYNIFLMTRARDEAKEYGARHGMLRALSATGGVITSAGLVLAGTFGVLALLPLVTLTQMGFAIAFGLLLDALVVRTMLVPALVFDVGPGVWWPRVREVLDR
jgi:putative drug exporter of the RND superfamily